MMRVRTKTRNQETKKLIKTEDYNKGESINPEDLHDLKAIADVGISNITLEDYPNLLVFPDSFDKYDTNFGKKVICNISDDGKMLYTNSIVGFVGRNKTHLSIQSRFANDGKEDFFLHYMLQKVAKINLFSLQHTMDEDSVFDFLIYLFPLYLKKAINQGIYKKYVTRMYNDANVRGVIDVNRHIRCNEPFNGKVAYNTREYDYDNEVTQLIRHTIEYIRKHKRGDILKIDTDTNQAVIQIVSATPSFAPNQVHLVINKNLRPLAHPYYSEYTPLQRLCLQILRHDEIKYGQKKDEIYGVLIDAAWLWEEYLAILLHSQYIHCVKNKRPKFFLFKPKNQQIIPDFLSLDKRIVADAKYIRLNEKHWFEEDSANATAIYYKTITYMYRFCSKKGYLLYPHPEDKPMTPTTTLEILSEQEGINGGTLIKLGLIIPQGCTDFPQFVDSIRKNEDNFKMNLFNNATVHL